MLKREKLTGKSKFIWVILGFLLMLPLAGSCSKEDSKENVVIPDIALNKSELTLEKGKTERLIASFTPAETPDNSGNTRGGCYYRNGTYRQENSDL